MKKAIIFLVILGLSSGAMADPYAKCVSCHGAAGETAAMGGKSKVISSMTKQEITDALKGYQAGTYGAAMKALMAAQTKGLSDADIQAIADKIGK